MVAKAKARTRKVPRVITPVVGVSMTRQSARDECDINLIMKRFEKTGIIEHFNEHRGDYGDFTGAPSSYQEALNQVLAADAMFQSLPARVRARFANDPGRFLQFVDDPANARELVDLGLAEPPAPAEAPAPDRAPAPSESGAGQSPA